MIISSDVTITYQEVVFFVINNTRIEKINNILLQL